MSYDDLQDEINRLRASLEEANTAREKLSDEREELINHYEEDFDTRRRELEEKGAKDLEDLKASQENTINTMSGQLDQMHRAFSGDTCGWAEKKDKRTGKTVFKNSETGEESTDQPMIMEFAVRVQNIDAGQTDKNAMQKAKNKALDAETAKRKMEVTVNETKSEIINLKSLLKNWTNASVEIFHELNTFDTGMGKVHDNVMARLPDMPAHSNKVDTFKEQAINGAARVKVKNKVIGAMNFEIVSLKKKNEALTKANDIANGKVSRLEEAMEKEIEELVAPLRVDVANFKADLQREKAARTEDRVELADLWPPGWLMPSVLMKYRTMNVDMKAEKRKRAMDLDAERAMKEDIRAKVLEASKWSEQVSAKHTYARAPTYTHTFVHALCVAPLLTFYVCAVRRLRPDVLPARGHGGGGVDAAGGHAVRTAPG